MLGIFSILLFVAVTVIAASIILWVIRIAPEKVVASDFKEILSFVVLVLAVIAVVIRLGQVFGIRL